MQRVYDLIGRVARPTPASSSPARAAPARRSSRATIHDLSRRRKQPFVPVNCGAISPTLIESELFGHERGSFTGADRQHKGYFERAHTAARCSSTRSPRCRSALQVKLLRVLETGDVLRVGADTAHQHRRAHHRRHQPPSRARRWPTGKLREDLLYRLNVFPIQLPPLRDRGDDVELLAEHFLAELNRPRGRRSGSRRPPSSGFDATPGRATCAS